MTGFAALLTHCIMLVSAVLSTQDSQAQKPAVAKQQLSQELETVLKNCEKASVHSKPVRVDATRISYDEQARTIHLQRITLHVQSESRWKYLIEPLVPLQETMSIQTTRFRTVAAPRKLVSWFDGSWMKADLPFNETTISWSATEVFDMTSTSIGNLAISEVYTLPAFLASLTLDFDAEDLLSQYHVSQSETKVSQTSSERCYQLLFERRPDVHPEDVAKTFHRFQVVVTASGKLIAVKIGNGDDYCRVIRVADSLETEYNRATHIASDRSPMKSAKSD